MPDDLRYLPICEPCIRGEGDECHTPGCALWMRDVPPDGLQEALAVMAAHDGDRGALWRRFTVLSGRLARVEALVAEWQERQRANPEWSKVSPVQLARLERALADPDESDDGDE